MSPYEWLENTHLGSWVRETAWGFPFSLILHAWSMAFLVGISLPVALGIFGRLPKLLPALCDKLMPFMWSAFGVSLVSGVALLSTYPAKVLANEIFYLKMLFISIALTLTAVVRRRYVALQSTTLAALPWTLKLLAAAMLLAWFCTISAGRLLYYTYGN